jgi:dihydrodipicolinate synthase/N-acetylneuraminate lyase
MAPMQPTTRERLLKTVFPNQIPRLWCPPLAHYDSSGAIDAARMAAHLNHLALFARGFLIPGSTGDGWELTLAERRQVLEIGIEQARCLNAHLLIGALHPDPCETLNLIRTDIDWLKSRSGEPDALKALAKAHVCGFTICPQRGQQLTQDQIGQSVASILELGLPTAIYQLPQVTLNEIGPDLAADLARRYQNFIFFKDTSGSDVVALSGKNLAGIFAARGAEGDYARWLKAAGGPYDGFLLSSANCFARELHRIIDHVSAGRVAAARQLSQRVATAISEIFALAANLPHGNPFANGNKAFDHFFAHGPGARDLPPPRLHVGIALPPELIHSAEQILLREKLMPAKGYLSR